MTPALQFEILDLRHFSANSLRPLLEEESRLWGERLRWDYRASADLLLQYLDSRVLPGFVAVERGRVSGYVFCVYEDRKGVIGDVFAMSKNPRGVPAVEIESRLLQHLIELLQNSPGIERIESQLLLHPHDQHAEIFRQAGFELYRRLFMERDLDKHPSLSHNTLAEAVSQLPPRCHLRPWDESDFTPAGRLISAAYANHLDSHINEQYRTVGGSLRFLHNIVRFPGCGIFDPKSSWVIDRPGGDELVGLLLCSTVREDVGHVTQICVASEYRGRGLGKLLIEKSAISLRNRGFHALTLTVTEQNTNAVALYRATGFVDRHSFDAMVWDHALPPLPGRLTR
jgi:ribosomal protein S18 acetylase RimI-like enzyme